MSVSMLRLEIFMSHHVVSLWAQPLAVVIHSGGEQSMLEVDQLSIKQQLIRRHPFLNFTEPIADNYVALAATGSSWKEAEKRHVIVESTGVSANQRVGEHRTSYSRSAASEGNGTLSSNSALRLDARHAPTGSILEKLGRSNSKDASGLVFVLLVLCVAGISIAIGVLAFRRQQGEAETAPFLGDDASASQNKEKKKFQLPGLRTKSASRENQSSRGTLAPPSSEQSTSSSKVSTSSVRSGKKAPVLKLFTGDGEPAPRNTDVVAGQPQAVDDADKQQAGLVHQGTDGEAERHKEAEQRQREEDEDAVRERQAAEKIDRMQRDVAEAQNQTSPTLAKDELLPPSSKSEKDASIAASVDEAVRAGSASASDAIPPTAARLSWSQPRESSANFFSGLGDNVAVAQSNPRISVATNPKRSPAARAEGTVSTTLSRTASPAGSAAGSVRSSAVGSVRGSAAGGARESTSQAVSSATATDFFNSVSTANVTMKSPRGSKQSTSKKRGQ